MTYDSILRFWLYRRFARAWRNKEVSKPLPSINPKTWGSKQQTTVPVNNISLHVPTSKQQPVTKIPTVPWNDFSNSSVLFVDSSHKIKYNYFPKGIDVIHKTVLKETKAFLEKEGTKGVYLCFDILPRQINKQFDAAPSKKKKIAPMAIPTTRIHHSKLNKQILRATSVAKKMNASYNSDKYDYEAPETEVEYEKTSANDKEIHSTEDEINELDGYNSDDFIDDEFHVVINDNDAIISDDSAPVGDNWVSFIKNKYLFPELVHYLTDRIINPQDSGYTFNVPYEKFLYLWGGNLFSPPPRSERIQTSMSEIEACTYENSVFFVGNSITPATHQFSRVCGRTVPTNFNICTLTTLKEAELSLMYFMSFHEYEDVTVLSGDGDLISILLLASRDRIDKNANWKNTVYFRFVSKSKSADDNQAQVEEININILYECINNDRIFGLNKGVTDPILHFVLISSLISNDYLPHLYGVGMVSINSKGFTVYKKDKEEATESISSILQTFIMNSTTYGNMIYFCIEPDQHSYFRIAPIRLDEEKFIQFIQHCYLTKYKSDCASSLKMDIKDVTVKDVRVYLEKYRSKKQTTKSLQNRIPTKREIRVISRNANWAMNYFTNTYKGNGLFPGSPLKLVGGYPFYGYSAILQKNGKVKCTKAIIVPKWVSIDIKYVSSTYSTNFVDFLREQRIIINGDSDDEINEEHNNSNNSSRGSNLAPKKKKAKLSKLDSFDDYNNLMEESDNLKIISTKKPRNETSIFKTSKISRVNVEKIL